MTIPGCTKRFSGSPQLQNDDLKKRRDRKLCESMTWSRRAAPAVYCGVISTQSRREALARLYCASFFFPS
jgi:hypothetical protein